MGRLPFAMPLVSSALLVASCVSRQQPLRVEIRPASAEEVALLVKGGNGLQLSARAHGLAMRDRRLIQFTAPGTLEIGGGEGDLELSTIDTTQRFVLVVKQSAAGTTHELETHGQWAVIRVRDGKMKVEAESMSMREVRTP